MAVLLRLVYVTDNIVYFSVCFRLGSSFVKVKEIMREK